MKRLLPGAVALALILLASGCKQEVPGTRCDVNEVGSHSYSSENVRLVCKSTRTGYRWEPA